MSYPTPLVTTQWLHDHLYASDIVILDVRGKVLPATQPPPWYISLYEDYAKGHIPGARFVNWITDITEDGPDNMQVASPEKYAQVMSRLGVSDDSHVIAYDAAGGMFAARLWWSLNYYGHSAVSVLDGGWTAWKAEGRPTSTDEPTLVPAKFTARVTPGLRLTKADVLAALGTDTRLLDVRTPEEFRGEATRAKRSGHIPGAVNLPAKSFMGGEHASLTQIDALKTAFTEAGAGDDQTVALYCNGGVSASLGLLAYRAAGFTGGAVYDGSWKDWGNDDDTPVER